MNLIKPVIWLPRYYHVSTDSFLTRVTPRIPIPAKFNISESNENRRTKRVCFAPSVDMCLVGKHIHTKEEEFKQIVKLEDKYRYYVYEPIEEFEVYIPNTRQVPDVEYTGEVWSLRKVNVRQVGMIEVLRESNRTMVSQADGRTLIIPTYEWKWLADNSWTFGRMHGDY